MKRGKKGQIYLIAALIIVGILVSFVAVSNYSKTQESVDVYDMGEELGIEGEHVLTYGVIKEGKPLLEVEDFTALYAAYAGQGKNLYFIYGNSKELTIAKYEDVLSGEIDLDAGGEGDSTLSIKGKKIIKNPDAEKQVVTAPDGKEIIQGNVKGEQDYTFELDEGDNFYFVIAQEIGGESHVIKSFE